MPFPTLPPRGLLCRTNVERKKESRSGRKKAEKIGRKVPIFLIVSCNVTIVCLLFIAIQSFETVLKLNICINVQNPSTHFNYTGQTLQKKYFCLLRGENSGMHLPGDEQPAAVKWLLVYRLLLVFCCYYCWCCCFFFQALKTNVHIRIR
jgi:hypothetical protein